MTDLLHVGAAILAVVRLTELVTMDKISEPVRLRFPHYLWGCPRCVSVWAGIACTAAYYWAPWLNWPLALAYLALVQWDWKSKAWAKLQEQIHIEKERQALQEREDEKHHTPVLDALGFRGNGR